RTGHQARWYDVVGAIRKADRVGAALRISKPTACAPWVPCEQWEVRLSYVLNTPEDRRAMLEGIGVKSVDELFQSIPASLRLKRPLDVPAALSEMELTQQMQRLAAANRPADDAVCFLGGGSYDHFIPAVVDAITGR